MRRERKIINIYGDSSIYSVKYVVSVFTEESLNEFWYFLGNSNYFYDEAVFEYLVEFYNAALSYIMKKEVGFFEIILEESEKYLYFTVWNKEAAYLFKKYSKKRALEYLYDKKRVTIRLDKTLDKKTAVHIPFTLLIDSAELQELEDFNENIQNILKQIGKIGFSDNLYIALKSNLSMLHLSLQSYKESRHVSEHTLNLLNLLHHNKKKFVDFKQNELKILDNFTKSIDHWLYNIFIKGEKDIHFMDDTLKTNYESIIKLVL